MRAAILSAVAALLLTAAPAAAEAVFLDFDSFPDGATPSLGPVSFAPTGTIGPPTVFTVTQAGTSSPPKALQAAQPCDFTCNNGAYQLRANFERGATRVIVRAGLGAGDGSEFGVFARMIGYDANGNQAGPGADSGDRPLDQNGSEYPITTAISVNDFSARIRYVILYVGRGTRSSDAYAGPRRARLDDFFVDLVDGPPPPPPEDPPPPTVSITEPRDDQFFARPEDVTLRGRVDTPGGFSAFCTTANDDSGIPAECTQGSAVRGDSTFGPVGVGALRPGRNTLTAWVRDARGRVASDTVAVEVSTGSRGVDVRANAMYVIQAVQRRTLFGGDGAPLPDPSREITIPYRGTRLVAGGKTVVRLFAHVPGSQGLATVRGVPALLYGFRRTGGRLVPLPGSPLSPGNGARTLAVGRTFGTDAELADPAGAYNFTLPASWTSGSIELRGEVNTTTGVYNSRLVECDACEANNRFTTTGINFERRDPITITPVEVTYRDADGALHRPTLSPNQAFEGTRAVIPLGEGQLNVRPYQAQVDVTELFNRRFDPDDDQDFLKRRTAIFDFVGDTSGRALGSNRQGTVIGLHDGGPGGYGTPFFASLGLGGFAIGGTNRPITEIAHEVFHTERFRHVTNDCGGGGIGWPSIRGRMFEMGLDRRPQRDLGLGQYRILLSPPSGFVNNENEVIDLMSYCAGSNENKVWVSQRSWDSFGDLLPYGIFARRAPSVQAAQGGGDTLRVVAGIDRESGSAALAPIKAGTPGAATPDDPEGTHRVEVRAADGRVVHSVRVTPFPGEDLTIAVQVPAAEAASVSVLRGDTVLATRSASANAPTVQVISPRAGTRLRSRGNVPIRWQASDPDPDTELQARVEYSTDGGRTYKPVTAVVGKSEASVPAALFGRTRNGRVRVTVNDGFREATAESGRISADGVAPVVSITSPAAGESFGNDVVVGLSGEAYDDQGRALTGRRLTWFDGRRRVATGETPTLSGLAAGRHTLRLVARDSAGRTGSATRRIRVVGTPPLFMGLQVPARISPRARAVTIRTGSTVTGTLRVGAQRFTVTRRVRSYRLRVKPGSGTLTLRLRLSAGGRATSVAQRIER